MLHDKTIEIILGYTDDAKRLMSDKFFRSGLETKKQFIEWFDTFYLNNEYDNGNFILAPYLSNLAEDIIEITDNKD